MIQRFDNKRIYKLDLTFNLKFEPVDYNTTIYNFLSNLRAWQITDCITKQRVFDNKTICVVGVSVKKLRDVHNTRVGIVSTSSMAFKKRGKEQFTWPNYVFSVTCSFKLCAFGTDELHDTTGCLVAACTNVLRFGDTVLAGLEITISGPYNK